MDQWVVGGRVFWQQSSGQLLEKFITVSLVKDACGGPGSPMAAQWHDAAAASGTESKGYSRHSGHTHLHLHLGQLELGNRAKSECRDTAGNIFLSHWEPCGSCWQHFSYLGPFGCTQREGTVDLKMSVSVNGGRHQRMTCVLCLPLSPTLQRANKGSKVIERLKKKLSEQESLLLLMSPNMAFRVHNRNGKVSGSSGLPQCTRQRSRVGVSLCMLLYKVVFMPSTVWPEGTFEAADT